MTDDEKRQQKGELLLSFQEAEDNLAALREKARNISSDLRGVQGWLDKLSGATTSRDLARVEFYSQPHARNINVLGDGRFRKSMDYDQVVSLTEQMIRSLQRVEELALRKRELGLK